MQHFFLNFAINDNVTTTCLVTLLRCRHFTGYVRRQRGHNLGWQMCSNFAPRSLDAREIKQYSLLITYIEGSCKLTVVINGPQEEGSGDQGI